MGRDNTFQRDPEKLLRFFRVNKQNQYEIKSNYSLKKILLSQAIGQLLVIIMKSLMLPKILLV